jgi:polygalacturonase
MKDGHGGVSIGSEVSGSVRNVFVQRRQMDSSNLQRALRLKSNSQRGGTIENVFNPAVRNVTVANVRRRRAASTRCTFAGIRTIPFAA